MRWLLIAVALLAGCGTKVKCERPQDCVDADESGVERVWSCVDQECVPRPCETSSDCEIGTYCAEIPREEDQPPQLFCAVGCQRTDDCRAGEVCLQGSCQERTCRSGHLDCELAEFCNPQTGQCEPAGFPFCSECDPNFTVILNELSCTGATVLGNEQCGGDGSFCWRLESGAFCGPACETNADCPGGFTCAYALRTNNACESGFSQLGRFCVSDLCR